MPQVSEVVWLNASPALQVFDRPLLRELSHHTTIAQWHYQLTMDEPIALETAIILLNEYLEQQEHPVHLAGHGVSGLLALLYARIYPEQVRSLTVLSVGVDPGVDWQSCYYEQLQSLSCPRQVLLHLLAYTFFGDQSCLMMQELVNRLEQDLMTSVSPHTLYQRVRFLPGGAPVPLLVCGSQDDIVIDLDALYGWESWLKPPELSSGFMGDRLWSCPDGRYFFHYFYPEQVGDQIMRFWNEQPTRGYVQSSLPLVG